MGKAEAQGQELLGLLSGWQGLYHQHPHPVAFQTLALELGAQLACRCPQCPNH